ncbi:MAG: YaiO family outer membrane beta-barrel protein [Ferruginibacter sp.]
MKAVLAKRYYLLLVFNLLLLAKLPAQTISSDEYFQMARKAAFENDNYPAAIRLSRQALQQSPGYTDIQLFLGRVYYWSGYSDSSMSILKAALESKPAYEDASVAVADVEYFSEHYSSALYYVERGLVHNPSSKELMMRKAKCLTALFRYKEAWSITDSLLQTDPKNNALRLLAARIKDNSSKNKIGISYDYTGFDKQFSNPWHILSLDYSRQAKAGSFAARLNYANRHTKNGSQVELDAYPRISKTFYAYTNIGYSNDMPTFPKFRAGFSLYANLPGSFEADAGFRYLNFDNDTWIYTLALGKYYKNFWFNGRTYLTPSNSRISQSYSLTTRYYGKGADNYFSLSIGQGISPDDRSLAIQLNNAYKLRTKRIAAAYRFSVRRFNIISFSSSFENVEYLPKTKGNQLNISVGFQRRF